MKQKQSYYYHSLYSHVLHNIIPTIILVECRTLWDEHKWIHVHITEQSHAHDRHQSVTETILSMLWLGHRVWHNFKYKHMNNTGTVSQATVQWSNPAGVSHTVYMDVLHTGSTSCALQDTCGTWCSLHQASMDRWSTFAVFFDVH